MHESRMSLPRSAFTPREVARAGDVWRVFQDLAVAGSSAAGWPPSRYRERGCSFIVRAMRVVHHREIGYGEPLVGTTWPSRIRRAMFFRREGRLRSGGALVAAATQEWVTVAIEASHQVAIAPAPPDLASAFEVESRGGSIELAERTDADAPSPFDALPRAFRFDLECFQTWTDPLGHVNHPQYVDWCDESVSRAMSAAGLDPIRLVPRAEEAKFKAAARAGDTVLIESERVGSTVDGAIRFVHEISCVGVAARTRLARVITDRAIA